jgi:hypothetical protein
VRVRQSDLDAFLVAATERANPDDDVDQLRDDLVASLERARTAVDSGDEADLRASLPPLVNAATRLRRAFGGNR